MTTSISLRDNINFEDTSSLINSITTFLMLPYIFVYPVFIIWFLRKNFLALYNKDFQARYNSLYLNVDYFNK